MGKLTNYSENELLDHVLVAAFSVPANLYLALCTADPGEAATGDSITEPEGNGYARKICNSWEVAASRATSNSAIIEFAEAEGSWGTITHFAICDALTSGNVLAYGEISPNKTVGAGDNVSVAVNDLDVSWNAGGLSDFLANELLDHVFKVGEYTKPDSVFAALATGTILDADGGSDISEPADGYTREATGAFSAASGGATDNDADITFGPASGAWGTVVHFGLLDTLTVAQGNLLFHAALATSRVVGVGDSVKFPAGSLDVTLD